MESAKSKRSSLKEGFQEAHFSKEQVFEPSSDVPKSSAFNISERTLQALLNQTDVRQYLETELERRFQEKLNGEFRTEANALKKKAHEEGFEAGKSEGIQAGLLEGQKKSEQELEKFRAKLSEMADGILAEKADVLRAHEESWVKALLHLMKRFLVFEKASLAKRIEKWVEETVQKDLQDDQLIVSLSPEDHKRVQAVKGARYKFEVDESLSSGSVRCRSTSGEWVFTSSEQMKRLETLVRSAVGESN